MVLINLLSHSVTGSQPANQQPRSCSCSSYISITVIGRDDTKSIESGPGLLLYTTNNKPISQQHATSRNTSGDGRDTTGNPIG